MNISSENFGVLRVTRYQNDAVTVLDTRNGTACNYPGGWEKYVERRKLISDHSKSQEHFIQSMALELVVSLHIQA